MIKEILDALQITPTQIKIFVFSFLVVSIMVVLQHLGIRAPIAHF